MRVQSGRLSISITAFLVCLCASAAGAPPTHTISGYVQTAAGIGVEGVNVVGNNGATSTTTQADGAYSIAIPNNWTGTVYASKSGWIMTPSSKAYAAVKSDIANENYTAWQPKISGTVTKSDGTPLAGVTITANNSGGTTTTNAAGFYELFVRYEWIGTVSASLAGYSFTPKTYSYVIVDKPDQNYTGFQPKISGYVRRADNSPIEGAAVNATNGGGSTVTNAGGYYELTVPYGWSGTVLPVLTGYSFTAKTYTSLTSNQVNQNFLGFQPKISGYVSKQSGGYLSGVTVSATGGGGSYITTSTGYYELYVPYGWTGLVSATLTGYRFTPHSYNNLTTSCTLQNFSGFQPTIAGYTFLSGATVTFSGIGSVTSTPSYSMVVPYGWTGTVTVTLTGYSFLESPRSYTDVTASLSGQNFTPFQPVISGSTVRSGATVAFSGIGSVTSNPLYSVTVPYGWTGTVTATLSGYNFPESPRSYTNVTASQTNQDFTPYQPKLSGYVKTTDGAALQGATITAVVGAAGILTNAEGYYEVLVPYNWSGTVQAAKAGWGIDPAGIALANIKADQTLDDFVAFQPTISGCVTKQDLTPFAAVSVTASNGGPSVLTDPNGCYRLTVPYQWTGTVTAAADGWGFAGSPRSYQNVTADLQGQDFSAFQPVISGAIADEQGAPAEGIEVSAAGIGSTQTDAQGGYSFTVPYGWSGTVTPAKTDWAFMPLSRTYTSVTADQLAQNYVLFQPVISGKVITVDGVAVANVELAVDGIGMLLTDNKGCYRFVVPFGWSGSVTPSRTQWGFSPATRTYSGVAAHQANQGFTMFQPQIRVMFRRPNAMFVNHVELTVAGFDEPLLVDCVNFDPRYPCEYAWTVPFGWSGTVTPSKEGFIFEPAVITCTELSQDTSYVFSAGYQYPGGDGTPEDPYQIWTAQDLHELSLVSTYWDKHFALMDDIDLSLPGAEQPVGPIGNQQVMFKGSFEGNNHTISHLTINTTTAYTGLFGRIIPTTVMDAPPCFVRNLGLVEPHITTTSGYVGALASLIQGNIINPVVIQDCFASGGSVQGQSQVGGLIGGSFYSTVLRCWSSAAVSGQQHVGGLFGISGDCMYVDQCSSSGDVAGDLYIGGFAGAIWNHVPRTRGTPSIIYNCYSQGSVSGRGSVAGFVGDYYNYDYQSLLFINDYSTGSVTAVQLPFGGFAATTKPGYAAILNCFWDTETSGQATSYGGEGKTTEQMMTRATFDGWGCGGIWTLDEYADYPRLAWQGLPGDPLSEEIYAGGSGTPEDPYLVATAAQLNAIGRNYCHLSASFRLTADINMNDLPAGAFRPIGLDVPFTGNFDGGGHTISNLNFALTTNLPSANAGLFGMVGDPYAPAVAPQIHDLVLADPNIVITSSGPVQGPVIASGALAGTVYAGSIYNIDIMDAVLSGTGYWCGGGAIGAIRPQSVHVSVSDVTCRGRVHASDSSGGIIGYVYNGLLTRCAFSGQVSGTHRCGGLAGYTSSSAIDQCYARGSVSGFTYVGGLTGHSSASMFENAFANCNVTGSNNVGGLIGYMSSSNAAWCYAAGHVVGSDSYIGGFVGYHYRTSTGSGASIFTGCVWDAQLNPGLPAFGVNPAAGVLDKNTEELYLQNTYTSLGWDFVNETANGTEDIWRICEQEDYARLAWESVSCTEYAGSGTSEDPYQIWTAKELYLLGKRPQYWSSHFKLMDDVDLSSPVAYDVKPIGTSSAPFAGSYDGNGHAVSGLHITADYSNVGLFGCLYNANVYDLTLIEPRITVGTQQYCIGTLFGRLEHSDVWRCTVVNGIVHAPTSWYVGMLGGSVADDSACRQIACSGTVTGYAYTGGLVGQAYGFDVALTECAFDGGVTGSLQTGGAIGALVYSVMSRCSSAGTVSGDTEVGGFAGNITGYVYDGYTRSDVLGNTRTGGFNGIFGEGAFNLTNCYAAGAVTGVSEVGGFTGLCANLEHNDFAACFWNAELNAALPAIANHTDADLVGLSTADMQFQASYANAGWDFVGETANGTEDIWQINAGEYPNLLWKPFDYGTPYDGSGTAQDPYRLSVPGHMLYLSTHPRHWSRHFILVKDIDLSAYTFRKSLIGSYYYLHKLNPNYEPFWGIFDGNHHVIRNLKIEEPQPLGDYQFPTGLFGTIGTTNYTGEWTGIVKNLSVENVNVLGYYEVGGLAGVVSGGRYDSPLIPASVINCYTTGSVRSQYSAGGLVGDMYYARIIDCSSSCQVSADSARAGGLIGEGYCIEVARCLALGNVSAVSSQAGGFIGTIASQADVSPSMIDNCYARGEVRCNNLLGGFVGHNWGYTLIDHCYSTGRVIGSTARGGFCGTNIGTIHNSFWDVSTSGTSLSSGAVGRTTAQMKAFSTYSNASWDVTGTWTMCVNTNYPRLLWQVPAGDVVCPDGVSMADFVRMTEQWLAENCNATNSYCQFADIDRSGTVALEDLAIFCRDWLEEMYMMRRD